MARAKPEETWIAIVKILNFDREPIRSREIRAANQSTPAVQPSQVLLPPVVRICAVVAGLFVSGGYAHSGQSPSGPGRGWSPVSLVRWLDFDFDFWTLAFSPGFVSYSFYFYLLLIICSFRLLLLLLFNQTYDRFEYSVLDGHFLWHDLARKHLTCRWM